MSRIDQSTLIKKPLVVVYSTESAYIVSKTISEGNAIELANDSAKSRAQE
jgi:hypothetical protein